MWLKDGQHYLDPRAVKTLETGTRAPTKKTTMASGGAALKVCVGNKAGESFSVRAPKPLANVEKVGANAKVGVLEPGWRRLVVRSTSGENHRTWVLEPSSKETEIHEGDFYVRGRFVVTEAVATAKKADALWRASKAE